MGKFILVHDLGTTGNKTCLFDRDFELVAKVTVPFRTYHPHTGFSEQAPAEWFAAVCESTKKILAKSGVSPSDIAGLSFSAHNPSCIPLDGKGESLLDRIPIYADLRAGEQVKWMMAALGEPDRFYNITGAGQIPEHYQVFKTLWLRENLPDLFKRAKKIINTVDYIVLRLTGKLITDFSQASNIGLMDINTRAWSEEILEATGIDRELLPALGQSGDIAGELTPAAAGEIGLAAGTPVVLGGADVGCATVGAGAIRPGICYANIGSAAWLGAYADDPLLDPPTRIVNLCHLIKEKYALHFFMTGAGICYQWLRDRVCDQGQWASARDGCGDVYEEMNAMAAKIPPGAGGLLFLPYMRGVFTGDFNPNPCGAFLGLSIGHEQAHLVRAVIEGIGLALRELVALFLSQGIKVDEIRLIGGGAKSAIWRQTMADICNIKIARPKYLQEAGSFGAAIACGVGLGWIKSFEQIEDYNTIQEIHHPDDLRRHHYDEIFEIFTKARRANAEIFNDLAASASS